MKKPALMFFAFIMILSCNGYSDSSITSTENIQKEIDRIDKKFSYNTKGQKIWEKKLQRSCREDGVNSFNVFTIKLMESVNP